jgi:hypothetical protein
VAPVGLVDVAAVGEGEVTAVAAIAVPPVGVLGVPLQFAMTMRPISAIAFQGTINNLLFIHLSFYKS